MAGALLVTADRALGQIVATAMIGSGVDLTVVKNSDEACRALVTMEVGAVVADAARVGDLEAARETVAKAGLSVPFAVIAGEGSHWNPWVIGEGAAHVFRRPVVVREIRDAIQRMVRTGHGDGRTTLPRGAVLDASTSSVVKDEERVVLTQIELQIMQVLAEAGGAIVPLEEMLHRVWVTDTRSTDSLRTHVRTIRVKLRPLGLEDIVETIPRRGHRLRME